MTARTYRAAEMRSAFMAGWSNGHDILIRDLAEAEAERRWPDPAPEPPAMTVREEGEAAGARPGGHPMTEPYTAEEMPKVVNALELKAEGTYAPVNYDRLIATLREYERVLAEVAALREAPQEIAVDRDVLGRVVREAWVRWAQTQPDPKPHWLAPYDELSEPDKEADRQIGEAVLAVLRSESLSATARDAEVAALRADKETLRKRLALAGMDEGVVVQQNGAVSVLCNDLWSFATADAEPIPDSELDCCIEVATRFGWDGLTAWACWRRQQEPMRFNGASPADSHQYKAAMAWLSARAAGEG